MICNNKVLQIEIIQKLEISKINCKIKSWEIVHLEMMGGGKVFLLLRISKIPHLCLQTYPNLISKNLERFKSIKTGIHMPKN